jgi:hypothetical protein
MHASVSSTLPDVLLESSLLARIQNLTGSQQKYDSIIAREIGGGKNRGVFGKIDGYILTCRQFTQGCNGIGNRGMAKASCL